MTLWSAGEGGREGGEEAEEEELMGDTEASACAISLVSAGWNMFYNITYSIEPIL